MPTRKYNFKRVSFDEAFKSKINKKQKIAIQSVNFNELKREALIRLE